MIVEFKRIRNRKGEHLRSCLKQVIVVFAAGSVTLRWREILHRAFGSDTNVAVAVVACVNTESPHQMRESIVDDAGMCACVFVLPQNLSANGTTDNRGIHQRGRYSFLRWVPGGRRGVRKGQLPMSQWTGRESCGRVHERRPPTMGRSRNRRRRRAEP